MCLSTTWNFSKHINRSSSSSTYGFIYSIFSDNFSQIDSHPFPFNTLPIHSWMMTINIFTIQRLTFDLITVVVLFWPLMVGCQLPNTSGSTHWFDVWIGLQENSLTIFKFYTLNRSLFWVSLWKNRVKFVECLHFNPLNWIISFETVIFNRILPTRVNLKTETSTENGHTVRK